MRTTDFCPTSNPTGTLIGLVSGVLSLALRQAGGPGRTAFHDAVARFGGRAAGSVERFTLAERGCFRATSDVPVALPRGSAEDRLTSHGVNRTWLPRPGAPSSFMTRQLLGGPQTMQHNT